jgi:hypothetical protein
MYLRGAKLKHRDNSTHVSYEGESVNRSEMEVKQLKSMH